MNQLEHKRLKTVLSLFTGLFFSIPIYIILHESGHALIAVFYGARITKFSVWGAYMSHEGGTFTPMALSLLNVAGMLLPLLLTIIFMLTYRSNATSIPYRIFSFLFALIPTCSVLAWIIVPALYLIGKAPQNDDVTEFINASGLSPWTVLFAAIIIFACCLFIAWKKKMIQNYWATLLGLSRETP